MLDTLNQVQRHDLDIDTLVEERGQTPEELLELKRQEVALRAELAQVEVRFQELRHEVNQNELELQTLDARRKSSAQSALEASTAKEASQYQNQEMQFSTRYQELEEDALPLIERLEGLEAELTRLRGELSELTPELERASQTEDDRVTAIEAKIGSLKGERDAVAGSIDAPLLKQYEQVRKARRGVGLVEVVDGQRCGGCNVRLPIHVVQKVRSGKGITRCPSCGRILWFKES
jgi:predicted  nucleic acid-binding Zn-ribbon protein